MNRSQILPQELIGIDEGLNILSPFYSEEKSRKLWLPTMIDLPVSDMNSSNGYSHNLTQNLHLFKQKKEMIPKICLETSWKSLPSLQQDTTEADDINVIARKIRFYPNQKQKKLFEKCFNGSRYFYNKSIEQLKYESKHSEKLSLNLPTLRNKIMLSDAELKDENIWQKDIPFDTRQLAIKEAIGSYKSSLKLKSKQHISHFTHRFKCKKDKTQIFHVDKNAYKNNKIFIRRLGKKYSVIYLRKKNKKLLQKFLPNGIEHDFTIQKTKTNKYYLILSKIVKTEKEDKPFHQIALDPGVRTFQTGYNPNGLILECGKKDIQKIKKLHDKIDTLQSLRTKGVKNVIKRIDRLNEKCHNYIHNMHRQLASFLTKNFDEIYLPSFNVKKMLIRNKRSISSKTAREMQILSFYRFKQLLQSLSKRRNTKLFIVNESHTTKTCGNCGILNNIGSSEIYECSSCHFRASRDINAARNIFMKNLMLDL